MVLLWNLWFYYGSTMEARALLDPGSSFGSDLHFPHLNTTWCCLFPLKSLHLVFYLSMLAVRENSSTTTKVRAASAKSSSGISLNDTLFVGPTVHSSLIDVLLRFQLHRAVLVAECIELLPSLIQIEIYIALFGEAHPVILSHDTCDIWSFSYSQCVCEAERTQPLPWFSLWLQRLLKTILCGWWSDGSRLSQNCTINSKVSLPKENILLRKWNSSELPKLNSICIFSDLRSMPRHWELSGITVSDLPQQEGLTKWTPHLWHCKDHRSSWLVCSYSREG